MKNWKINIIIAAICLSMSACSGQQYEVVYLESSGKNTSDFAESSSFITSAASESVSEITTVTSAENSETTADTVGFENVDNSAYFSERDKKTDYESCSDILLKDGKSVVGDGAEVSGDVITITMAGTYRLSGVLTNGQIIVDCGDEKVQLVLDNAEITCNGNAAIYVKKADKVFVTLAENSVNKLISTGDFTENDKVDGAVFSKADITFNGNGTLKVESTAHGIVGKDDLKIAGGTFDINSKKKGLSGGDSVVISDCSINITSKSHGICSKNDNEEKGNISIVGGCNISITSDDDGMHASGTTEILTGRITISAGDDGIHSDANTIISEGVITVANSKEGIEGHTVTISGGVIDVTSSDDGINAAGGNDASGSENGWGRGGKGGFDVDESAVVSISGGEVTVNANGDGIDSNGRLLVSGGIVYVSGPINSGNGALDSGSEATITGGTVIAAGAAGMAENFSGNSTQGSILCSFDSTIPENTAVLLMDKDGNVIAEYTPVKRYECVVISSPEIKAGETYTIEAGSVTKIIEMTSLVYGSGFSFGGGFGGSNGFGGLPREGGEGSHGNFDNGSRGNRPDRNNLPEVFNKDALPEGIDKDDFDSFGTPPDFQNGELPEVRNINADQA